MRKLGIGVLALIIVAGVGSYALNSAHAPASAAKAFPMATSTAAATGAPQPHRTPPAGTSEYYSASYRFSLFYPDDLVVKEYNEGGGAETITFQNVQDAKGFQIFIVPYSGSQVSAERFRMDEPSGVRDGQKEVTINGAVGASFYGRSASLGDTAEIWFIHGGYLYEVTTLKPLAPWLSEIMQSWQFAS